MSVHCIRLYICTVGYRSSGQVLLFTGDVVQLPNITKFSSIKHFREEPRVKCSVSTCHYHMMLWGNRRYVCFFHRLIRITAMITWSFFIACDGCVAVIDHSFSFCGQYNWQCSRLITCSPHNGVKRKKTRKQRYPVEELVMNTRSSQILHIIGCR